MVLHSLPPDQFDRGSNQTSPSNDPRRTYVRKLASRNQLRSPSSNGAARKEHHGATGTGWTRIFELLAYLGGSALLDYMGSRESGPGFARSVLRNKPYLRNKFSQRINSPRV